VTPASCQGISADVPLIAQMLKKAGYCTAQIGDWHVGTNTLELLPI
jgi:arylsulfatase A-like enzyme